ncbi:MAG TPA: PAS domain S-box protein, partial [Dehalococcoidia bacterium]|nr:PAS domain S-box protein [Dehalococcoidia bacterium]
MSDADSVSRLYGQLIAKAGEGVIIASNDGTILEWNDSAARIFGWTREQAIGENIDMLIPDNQKDDHWAGYDRVLETGVTKYSGGEVLAVSSLRADGSRIGVDFSITPLVEDGKVVAIAAIIRP